MADVAKVAGVSAMTVSRALREDASVSKATRARVLEVIDDLGYVPDQAAGALSSGRSKLVGMIAPSFTSAMYGAVARGLDATLTKAGLQLFLGFADFQEEREEQALEALLRRRPEAVVLSGGRHTPKAMRMLANASVPVVEFFCAPVSPAHHVVAVDLRAAGRLAVERLAAGGRRSLVVIGESDGLDIAAQERAIGAREAAAEKGFREPTALYGAGAVAPIDFGAHIVGEMLARRPDVDGVVCGNDGVAIGVIAGLRRHGRRVPDDVAVIGFGDHEVGRHLDPALTTIGFNAPSLGVEVGKVLLSAFEAVRAGDEIKPYRLSIGVELVGRDSA
ncbi:LacI family transcriptional regulator [Methylopila jiangsuensis]|uniref:LacI family transcriptional regulator n=2 Tax=Methylopila jiangsuensis TaxID=586230 RepID=A0A9W6N513_9HYPH|nr:LacI family transcriptional regulator [Methylopila jiangsuensis]